MALFNKMSEPIFLKESNVLERQLEDLKELEALLNKDGQALLRKDMKCLEYGIIGEKNIIFELKNSHMPLYILHDVYLQDGELGAQIDFMVFTRKMCFVIECKNLYGDIQITKEGDFVRSMTFGSKKIKEGIYSPITQNERHIQLMKKIKKDKRNNFLTKMVVEKFFENMNQSVVVLSNPKTVLDTKYAKKEIKDKVIRGDQLITYMKHIYSKSKDEECSDESMLKWAQSYLDLHQEVTIDYKAKYEKYIVKEAIQEISVKVDKAIDVNIEETELYQKLKKFRLDKSREEKIKPYFIYNNKELEALIERMPTTLDEIEEVQGFGKVKVEKYGRDLLKIFDRY